MAMAIEDAGFEIRDQIGWAYGSGFPKSHSVSKGIDKAAGARGHDSVGFNVAGKTSGLGTIQRPELRSDHPDYVKPSGVTPEARQWQGWGTALKPAWEPICLARKPLCGTVAENVLAHGTGAITVDGCRVANADYDPNAVQRSQTRQDGSVVTLNVPGHEQATYSPLGRWPANICHDGSPEVLACFPDGGAHGGKGKFVQHAWAGREATEQDIKRSTGSAARFFYAAKASRADRDAGLESVDGKRANSHPTVKPVSLCQWLCRLVTPPGGVILDPFMGSGSTGKAAVLEGFQFVGCEREHEYMPIAAARIAWAIGRVDDNERPAPPQPAAANDNATPDQQSVNDLFSAIGAAA